MTMQMSGPNGLLSVPAEHLPALVVVVVAPLVLWVALGVLRVLAEAHIQWAEASERRLAGLSFAAKAAIVGSLVGAAAHLAIVPTHWGDERVTAFLFLADTVGFVIAAGWAWSGRRHWQLANLAMLGGTVGAYAWYLLAGWETPDLAGLLVGTVELGAALVLLAPAMTPLRSRTRQRWLAAAALPVALLFLVGTSVVADATQHSSAVTPTASAPHQVSGAASSTPPGSGMPGMTGAPSSTATTPLSLPTSSPAGSVVWPVNMTTMAAGMQMATPNCTAPPTAAQQQAAVQLVNQTVTSTQAYKSLAAATAAGYIPVTPPGQRVVHYINPTIYRQGDALNPSAVPALVYVNTQHGAVLTAAMYLVPRSSDVTRPPQPAGCLTQWHIHSDLCFSGGHVVGNNSGGACPAGSTNQTTQPMMHVWLAPVTGGPLAPDPPARSEVIAAAELPAPNPPNATA